MIGSLEEQVERLRADLRAYQRRTAAVEADVAVLRATHTADFAALRTTHTADFAALRTAHTADFAALRTALVAESRRFARASPA
jgi:hypothetical protein